MTVEEKTKWLLHFCYEHTCDGGCDKCPLSHNMDLGYYNCDFNEYTSEKIEHEYNLATGIEEDKEMKEKKYIYVNLPLKNGAKNYLFCIPDGAEVAYGDTLVCKTYNGHELEGTAVSNPVTLDRTFLAIMAQEVGFDASRICYVVGKHTIQRF